MPSLPPFKRRIFAISAFAFCALLSPKGFADTWFEQTTAGGSAMYGQLDSSTAAWVQQTGDPDGAYAVFGNTFVPVSTPEPASVLLVFAGLVAVFARGLLSRL